MKKIVNKLHFTFGKKLPIILQIEVTECGFACIAMIANYHSYETNLLSLRRKYSASLQGDKLQNLIDLAKRLNLSSRAIKLKFEDLKNLKTPCILCWGMDHLVVLKKVKGNIAIIHDPTVGVIKRKMLEISKHFTGVAIEFYPVSDFQKKKDKRKLYLSDLWGTIIGLKLPILQIILISIALEVFAIISPLYMQFVMDNAIIARDFPLIYVLAIGFGMLIVIQAVTSYVRSWVILYLSNVLNIQLAANLIRHLFKLPVDFFEKRHVGDIMSRFVSMSTIQDRISIAFIESIVDGIMAIATLFMMLIYSSILSLIVFIALLFYITIKVSLYSTIKLYTQESLVTSAKEISVFMESVRAILPLKIFRKETLRENIWQNNYADKLNSGIRLARLGLISQFSNQIIFGIEHILIVLFGAILIMKNEFSIGMLLAYISYRQQFVNKAQSMVDKVMEYKMISLHLERVADIALTKPEEDVIGMEPQGVQGNIEVKNLSFSYSGQDSYVFKKINFKIKAGESVAIMGTSGCGKSTLIKLMLSLLVPTSGEILIDGVNIKKLGIHFFRSQIAAVMQDDTLMSGSIADNICFFDSKANINRIYSCAKLQVIHEEVMHMPMNYETLVGDMGTMLSGGQKQRILLARALYKEPKVLFLDEATSHLDVNNENVINRNLKQIAITRIVIAHRKETVSMADKVIDLEKLGEK